MNGSFAVTETSTTHDRAARATVVTDRELMEGAMLRHAGVSLPEMQNYLCDATLYLSST